MPGTLRSCTYLACPVRRATSSLRSTDLHGTGRHLHGADDVVVAGAAAEVALQRVPDLLLARVRGLPEQADRSHDEAGRAVAALQPVLHAKGLLHRMERAVRRQALDRRDLVPIRLNAQQRARLDRLPIQQNGARATRGRVAADVRTGQSEPLAQHIDEQLARVELERVLRPVDRDRDASHSASFWPLGNWPRAYASSEVFATPAAATCGAGRWAVPRMSRACRRQQPPRNLIFSDRCSLAHGVPR